jgi:hypothetical protein
MDSTEDNILAKEIESWKGFEYALRKQSAEPLKRLTTLLTQDLGGLCRLNLPN